MSNEQMAKEYLTKVLAETEAQILDLEARLVEVQAGLTAEYNRRIMFSDALAALDPPEVVPPNDSVASPPSSSSIVVGPVNAQPLSNDKEEDTGIALKTLRVSFNEAAKPTGLIMSNGISVAVTDWNDLPEEICKFFDVGPAQCPIRMPRATIENLVDIYPLDRVGKAMGHPYQLPSGVWLEKRGDAPELVRKAKYLVEHLGGNTAEFRIVLS